MATLRISALIVIGLKRCQMRPFIELLIAIIISIVYYQILLIGVVEMNPMEMLNLSQEYLFNRTVLFDTRTKQRVVITSHSYNINKIKESTMVITPLKLIGVKDNSHMYEPSEAYNMGLTKNFNEWFSNDPKILFDDFDVLKVVEK